MWKQVVFIIKSYMHANMYVGLVAWLHEVLTENEGIAGLMLLMNKPEEA